MKQNWKEYLDKELVRHHDNNDVLKRKRTAFYQDKYNRYLNEGRNKENADAQIQKEIKQQIKKRDTPDIAELKTTFNTAFASILFSVLEVIQLLFSKNRSSIFRFTFFYFLALFFVLIRLAFKRIRFSIPNIISVGLRSASVLATIIQLFPFLTTYKGKIRMPDYLFPGYIKATELLEKGSTALPRTKVLFLTDRIVSILLVLFSLILYIRKKRETKKKISHKLLHFELGKEE